MTTTEPNRPALTAVQRVEIGLYEEAITDNLRGPVPQPPSLVLVLSEELLKDPEHVAKTERHIRLMADVARYFVTEGITTEHFDGYMPEFPICSNVAWILRGRDDFFKEPGSCGYAVLVAAGFNPPSR